MLESVSIKGFNSLTEFGFASENNARGVNKIQSGDAQKLYQQGSTKMYGDDPYLKTDKLK